MKVKTIRGHKYCFYCITAIPVVPVTDLRGLKHSIVATKGLSEIEMVRMAVRELYYKISHHVTYNVDGRGFVLGDIHVSSGFPALSHHPKAVGYGYSIHDANKKDLEVMGLILRVDVSEAW